MLAHESGESYFLTMAANQPPPGIDLTEDQGQRIVSSMVALIVLPTLAVIARLLSRYLAHAGFWVSTSVQRAEIRETDLTRPV